MKLYNGQIDRLAGLLCSSPSKRWAYNPGECARECDKNTIIFRDDAAFELGGMGKPSVYSVMYTDADEAADEVLLYGADIADISEDSPFAHIVITGLDENNDELHYEELKNIEFSVYRLSLKDYGIRISPGSEREQVRVGKSAKSEGLSFFNIGCSCIKEFKKNPLVKSVKVIFITDNSFDYTALSAIARKVTALTKTLTSEFGNLEINCNSCAMKPLCDEVEGLRELHFKKQQGH